MRANGSEAAREARFISAAFALLRRPGIFIPVLTDIQWTECAGALEEVVQEPRQVVLQTNSTAGRYIHQFSSAVKFAAPVLAAPRPVHLPESSMRYQKRWDPTLTQTKVVIQRRTIGGLMCPFCGSWCTTADGDGRNTLSLKLAGHLTPILTPTWAHCCGHRRTAWSDDAGNCQRRRSVTDPFERLETNLMFADGGGSLQCWLSPSVKWADYKTDYILVRQHWMRTDEQSTTIPMSRHSWTWVDGVGQAAVIL